jgi:hypothetical protein
MYALADKYGIEDLKELAREKFARVATRDWNKGGGGGVRGANCVRVNTQKR